MPFISTKTNRTLSEKEKITLKEKLGEAIAIIPGKSERWLMLSFEDGLTMSLAGDMSATAMIDVEIFGSATEAAYAKLTAEITRIVSEVATIPADRIYVKYREVGVWGYNGENF